MTKLERAATRIDPASICCTTPKADASSAISHIAMVPTPPYALTIPHHRLNYPIKSHRGALGLRQQACFFEQTASPYNLSGAILPLVDKQKDVCDSPDFIDNKASAVVSNPRFLNRYIESATRFKRFLLKTRNKGELLLNCSESFRKASHHFKASQIQHVLSNRLFAFGQFVNASYPNSLRSTRTVTSGTSYVRTIIQNRSRGWNLKYIPQARNPCAAPATIEAAAACDGDLRQRRLIWVGAAYRLAVVALLPPLTYASMSLECALNCLVQKLDIENHQTQSLQTMLAQLLQEVLFETFAHAKEELVGASRLGVCVLERFELERADVIGNLRNTIARRRRVAVNNGLLGQCELDGIMQRLGNQGLPVVVIDLNFIELLQIIKVIKQEDRDVPPDALDCAAWRHHVGVELGLLIGKRRIPKREVLQKDAERCEVLLALLNIHAFVSVVAVKQRREMERDIPKPHSIQSIKIVRFVSSKSFVLFMEYEDYKVVLGFGAGIAGFINEYGKIPHSPHAPNNKNAGGKPPAVGGPPCGEDHLRYTTRRFGNSITPKYEHMFFIIDTNTCSPHRKAA